jgi:hypothetical protein
MSDDPIASSTVVFVPPAADDFDTMLAAITGTPHGRWFLQEFMRRHRSADVEAMLAAVERIGAAIARDRIALADQDARTELSAMAKVIAERRAGAPDARPAERILDELEHRIGAWLAGTAADTRLEPAGQEPAPARLGAPAGSDACPDHHGDGSDTAPGHPPAAPDGKPSAPPVSGQALPACIPSMWDPVPVPPSLRRTKNGSDTDERDY